MWFSVSRPQSLVFVAVVFGTCAQILFGVGYKSTDMEVHRNWMAIATNVPPSEWYYEETAKQHTLDYPPLFAWLERGLGRIGRYFDGELVELSSEAVDTPRVRAFMVVSSILTGVFYLMTVIEVFLQYWERYSKRWSLDLKDEGYRLFWVLFFPALQLVDFVHFQYNSFLLGLLLLAVWMDRSSYFGVLGTGVVMVVLVLTKHLFLVLGPATVVVLYKSSRSVIGFIGVVLVGALLSGAVLWTVVDVEREWWGLDQMLSRLFPVHRGLLHAYWAPNVWALVGAADVVLSKLGMGAWTSGKSTTSGLVGDPSVQFRVLPTPTPLVCALLSLIGMAPFLLKAIKSKTTSSETVRSLFYHCLFSAFLFGWHVHEKALLPIAFLVLLHPYTQPPSKSRSLPTISNLVLPLTVCAMIPLFPTPLEQALACTMTIATATCSPYPIPLPKYLPLAISTLAILVTILLLSPLPSFPFLGLLLNSSTLAFGLTAIYLQAALS